MRDGDGEWTGSVRRGRGVDRECETGTGSVRVRPETEMGSGQEVRDGDGE